jgi:hypothetical protein
MSRAFGEFIGDACHGRTARIRFEPQSTASQEPATCRDIAAIPAWSKIRPPAGSDMCGAASGDRAARYYPKLRFNSIAKQPATTTACL